MYCAQNEKANVNTFQLFFQVVANPDPAPAAAPEDVGGMPDWAIAVVVIGLGSFAFVLVFGITVVSGNPIY